MPAYTAGMRKSLGDKIWFLGKLDEPVKGLYDYGCADGALLEMVSALFPDWTLIGYDIDPKMVELAKRAVPNALISTEPRQELFDFVLNASSVFHEIYAYKTDVSHDYRNIFGSGAKFIAIRDMFFSECSCHKTPTTHIAQLYQNQPRRKIEEFENFNGSLVENKNFLHYLLKYRYESNWEREVRENYFPLSIENFLSNLPCTYQVIYFEHNTLPFLKCKVFQDFGIELSDPTHAKILLKKI